MALTLAGGVTVPGCGDNVSEGGVCAANPCPPFAWGWYWRSVSEDPLAERSQADISVTTNVGAREFVVSSDALGIAGFSHEPGDRRRIRATGGLPGIAHLTLADPHTGNLLASTPIEVAPVARVTFGSMGLDYKQTFTVMTGGTVSLFVSLRDADGRQMAGVGGVDYAVGDGITDAEVAVAGGVAAAAARTENLLDDEYVRLVARAPGAGRMRVTAASGAATELPVAVVDETAVARVSFGSSPTFVGAKGGTVLRAEAFTAGDEPIHSPACAWKVEFEPSGAVVVSERRDEIALDGTGAFYTIVRVTCTVGAASVTSQVTFQDNQPERAP